MLITMGHTVDKLSIVKHIQQSNELLSLPQSLSEILREVDNPNFNSEQLSQIILKDPALTARILKLSNSSFYQRFSTTKTVQQAVQVLGVTTVKCLALSSSVFRLEKVNVATGIDPKHFFADVLTVAAAAEQLAREIDYKAPEEAFIAGLLHHIGIMFFLHHYPAEYKKLVSGQVKSRTLLDAETEVFGIDHCQVGHLLATRWRLPQFIADAIRDHHSAPLVPADRPVSNCVALASLLSPSTFGHFVADMEGRTANIESVAHKLGLGSAKVPELSQKLVNFTLKVAEYLDVDIGSVDDMMARSNRELWRAYLLLENLFRERQELSQRLLAEERTKGALESKNIAIATLSHYLNNAVMAIFGRSQLIRMQLEKKRTDEIVKRLPEMIDTIDNSIRKIVAVLAEIKDISPIDAVEFLSASQAMNIDDRIVKRLAAMSKESGIVLPQEAESTARQ